MSKSSFISCIGETAPPQLHHGSLWLKLALVSSKGALLWCLVATAVAQAPSPRSRPLQTGNVMLQSGPVYRVPRCATAVPWQTTHMAEHSVDRLTTEALPLALRFEGEDIKLSTRTGSTPEDVSRAATVYVTEGLL